MILDSLRSFLPSADPPSSPSSLDVVRATLLDTVGGNAIKLELVTQDRRAFVCVVDSRMAHELSDQLLRASALARHPRAER